MTEFEACSLMLGDEIFFADEHNVAVGHVDKVIKDSKHYYYMVTWKYTHGSMEGTDHSSKMFPEHMATKEFFLPLKQEQI